VTQPIFVEVSAPSELAKAVGEVAIRAAALDAQILPLDPAESPQERALPQNLFWRIWRTRFQVPDVANGCLNLPLALSGAAIAPQTTAQRKLRRFTPESPRTLA
jgi:hypothetical protein